MFSTLLPNTSMQGPRTLSIWICLYFNVLPKAAKVNESAISSISMKILMFAFILSCLNVIIICHVSPVCHKPSSWVKVPNMLKTPLVRISHHFLNIIRQTCYINEEYSKIIEKWFISNSLLLYIIFLPHLLIVNILFFVSTTSFPPMHQLHIYSNYSWPVYTPVCKIFFWCKGWNDIK